MAERDERLYRFDPLDGSGIFLGLGAIQCALLGGGLVLAVVALNLSRAPRSEPAAPPTVIAPG